MARHFAIRTLAGNPHAARPRFYLTETLRRIATLGHELSSWCPRPKQHCARLCRPDRSRPRAASITPCGTLDVTAFPNTLAQRDRDGVFQVQTSAPRRP